MNIIEISNSNYQDYLSIDIVAFSFAYAGAMGEPGGINIIDRAGQIYHANYCFGDNLLDSEHIKEIIPMFEGIDWMLIGCEPNHDEWVAEDLGFGNHLLMLKEFSNGFQQKVEAANIHHSGELFQKWPGFVLGLLGKEGQNLTTNDIWKLKKSIDG